MGLKEKRCVPCEGGTPPLDDGAISKLLGQVSGWSTLSEAGQPRLRKPRLSLSGGNTSPLVRQTCKSGIPSLRVER